MNFNISSYMSVIMKYSTKKIKSPNVVVRKILKEYFFDEEYARDISKFNVKKNIKKNLKESILRKIDNNANEIFYSIGKSITSEVCDFPSQSSKVIISSHHSDNNINLICSNLYKLISDSDNILSDNKRKCTELVKQNKYLQFIGYSFFFSLFQFTDFKNENEYANFNNLKKLKKEGIDLLCDYVDDNLKKLMKEKFNNISGKTGQYSVPDTLFQKRTQRSNRVLIPFTDVVNSKLTYEQLKTIRGGVAVEFVNNDYFNQLALPECKQNDVFKKLKNKLGTDEIVSAVIVIRSNQGSSSSAEQRKSLQNLLDKFGEIDESMLIKRKDDVKYSGKGNDVWSGFIYYNISGGNQDVKDSHKENRIDSKKVQLFNPAIEYAGENISLDITLTLIYFALHSIEKNMRNQIWTSYIGECLSYFNTRSYKTLEGRRVCLSDYVRTHVSLNIEEDILYDPIQVKKINISDFTLSSRLEDSLDITHQSSVKQAKYIYDELLINEKNIGCILSPANPVNLFWSKHLSNMMQQDYSLKEYFNNQRNIIKRWDRFDVDRLL